MSKITLDKLNAVKILTSKYEPKNIIAKLMTVFSEKDIPLLKKVPSCGIQLFIIKPNKIAREIDPIDTKFER